MSFKSKTLTKMSHGNMNYIQTKSQQIIKHVVWLRTQEKVPYYIITNFSPCVEVSLLCPVIKYYQLGF